jgi:DNA repair photolyase
MTRSIDNPRGRWQATEVVWDEAPPEAQLEIFEEHCTSALAENDSPDIPFRWGLNPYRGCMHACAYCYARPTHEYLGFGAGTDFDRKIVVKVNIAERLRETFMRRSWRGESVMLSGNTDCYQPIEGRYRLTRACLEVFAAFRNPVGLITKNAMVCRDLDLLRSLARVGAVSVAVSIPFIDETVARKIEPWASSIEQRFEALRTLADAGVPCGVAVSPIIPGLNDSDVAMIVERAHAAGARSAFMTLLHLPGSSLTVFDTRMAEAFPDRARRIEHGLIELRRGRRDENRPGERMRGHGARWEIVRQLFHTTCRRLGMNAPEAERVSPFRRPSPQGSLFDD